ncbi:DUF2913 family protein [Cronobacter muytjensii]|nr:DUF2913 family protein [Cronobacter muytjensii]
MFSDFISPAHSHHTFAHLIFCSLTALYLSRQEYSIDTPYAENKFLLTWLKQARKQKRFSRALTPNIDLLIKQVQKQGLTGSLRSVLEELWLESSPCDLENLTRAIEILIDEGWQNATVTDEEWGAGERLHGADPPAFYVRRSALNCGFFETGKLLNPVDFAVYGNHTLFTQAFKKLQSVIELTDNRRAGETIVTLVPQ